LTEAEYCYRRVLAVDPRHADSLNLLGVVYSQTGRFDSAVETIRMAIAINPMDARYHSNLGMSLRQQGRLEDAVASYHRALELNPAYPEAHNNLGVAAKELGRLDQAVACHRRALDLRPDLPDLHHNLAIALLARGDLALGWPEYEWRWKTPQMIKTRRDFAQPQWRGEAANGQTLLIHAEQGFGDSLHFCRYAPLAAACGLRVIMQVPKSLVRLFGGLPGVDLVVADGEELPPFDFHCPMLSMPLAMGTTIANIPSITPYLHADTAQVSAWQARLSKMEKRGPRIGLTWASNQRNVLDARRSLAPDRLACLFDLPGLHFFSLQKEGPVAPEDFPLTDLMSEMGDFADTAALIANLDLVISVDTAVAHLAAALGKPVWLLSSFDPCWRWLVDRHDSPWYPTLRLFRQPKPGDWDAVLKDVQTTLHKLVDDISSAAGAMTDVRGRFANAVRDYPD
jgi:lipoprotein NlpI